jgi:hypothetical protein
VNIFEREDLPRLDISALILLLSLVDHAAEQVDRQVNEQE